MTSVCADLLESAVALRLRSDVAMGCSLSGGLDSSAIAAVAIQSGSAVRAFSFGHPGFARSEGPVVARFSTTLGLDTHYIWREVSFSSDVRASVERAFQAQEAPFTTLSIVAQQEVFKAVRLAGVKVLLGGQGADEAFAGYRKFTIVALREAVIRRRPEEALRCLFSAGAMLFAEASQWGQRLHTLKRYFHGAAPRFKLLDLPIAPEQLLGMSEPDLQSRQVLDVLRWSLPTLLRYEDRNSMANGVETRLPFLDYRLMETALALPNAMKIRNGYAKWALRDAVKGLVPDSIRLNRAKRGFDVAEDWFTSGLGSYLRESLSDQGAAGTYLRSPATIGRQLDDEALSRDPGLVAEALVAMWLVKPVREPLPPLPPAVTPEPLTVERLSPLAPA